MPKLRIIVMGTGPFAVPLFEALAAGAAAGEAWELLALVTQPQRPAVGNKPPPVNPMRVVAERLSLPVLSPESINTDAARAELRAFSPELFVVADYGQILKPETLEVARLGGINLHGSLLPKYRGAAPINWAVYNGETETGVTVIQMSPRIDAGPAIAQASLVIDPAATAEDLEPRLANLGAGLIRETVRKLAEAPDSLTPLPQSPEQVTKAPRLKKTDGSVDWTRTAEQIRNQWRAMQPWPKCSTNWLRDSAPPVRLILGRMEALTQSTVAAPGTVLTAQGNELVIAAGQGAVGVLELQLAGKRMMPVADVLRGHRIEPGDRFGEV